MKRKPFILLFAMLLITVSTAPSQSYLDEDEEYLWEHPESNTFLNSEIAFSSDRYRFTKNEGVYFMSRFNDGWVFMMNLFWFDSPLFNTWGIYVLVTDPQGETFWTNHELQNNDVTYSTDYLYVSDGKNEVYGRDNTYHIKINVKRFSCDLVFQNILPPWKPGDGVYYLSGGGEAFQHRIIHSPWAWVKGSIRIEGKTIEVTGQGYGEKTLTINPLTKLNPLLYSMRIYSTEETGQEDRWHIGLLDIEIHPSYGSKRIPRLVVCHGQEYIFATQNYTIKPLDFVYSEDITYAYPRRLHISAFNKGYTLEGEYVSRKLYSYVDVLAELPLWFKAILLIFLDRPVYFRCLGEFHGTLVMPDGSIESLHLHGPYEYVVVK